jgi:DNA repair photolyase
MKINEVYCKSALSKSGLFGVDYALNPYRGCEHACVYCYAPAIIKEKREWGKFVDVKINIPTVLANELKHKKKGLVYISSVTDAYQPIEKKYEITRKCLNVLLNSDFPITIQTKSILVLRDLDIIKKFSDKDIGFTITTIDDEDRKKYEPNSSSTEEKINALKEIAEAGINTWVFIGPFLPYITDKDENIEKLIKKLAEIKVKNVMIDKLNLKIGTWNKIQEFLNKNYPELIQKYKEIFFEKSNYYNEVKIKVARICKENNLRFEFCY